MKPQEEQKRPKGKNKCAAQQIFKIHSQNLSFLFFVIIHKLREICQQKKQKSFFFSKMMTKNS